MPIKSFESLIQDYPHEVTILSQASSFIYTYFDNISWAGFYLVEGDSLYLGPFNGKPACTYIPFSKGVCGACATKQEVVVVNDVHKFPGHIACDEGANSEIVLPIFVNNSLYAVLDIDSYSFNRFEQDCKLFEELALIVSKELNKIKR